MRGYRCSALLFQAATTSINEQKSEKYCWSSATRTRLGKEPEDLGWCWVGLIQLPLLFPNEKEQNSPIQVKHPQGERWVCLWAAYLALHGLTSNARLPGAKQLNKGSAVQAGWCETWPRCLGSTILPPLVDIGRRSQTHPHLNSRRSRSHMTFIDPSINK